MTEEPGRDREDEDEPTSGEELEPTETTDEPDDSAGYEPGDPGREA